MSKKIHSIKIGNETYELDIPKSEFEVIDPAVATSYDGIVYNPNSKKPVRNTCVEYLSDYNGNLKNLVGNMNVNLNNSYETGSGGNCEYYITSNTDKFSLKLGCADDGHDTWSGINMTGPFREADDGEIGDFYTNDFVLYNYDFEEGSHIDIGIGVLNIHSSHVIDICTNTDAGQFNPCPGNINIDANVFEDYFSDYHGYINIGQHTPFINVGGWDTAKINIGKDSDIIEIGTGDKKYANKSSRIDIGATSSVNINCFDSNQSYYDDYTSNVNTTKIGSVLSNTVGLPAIHMKDDIVLYQNSGDYYIDVTQIKKYVFTGYPVEIDCDGIWEGYLWIDEEYYYKFLTFIKKPEEFCADYCNYWPILVTSYPTNMGDEEIYFHGVGSSEYDSNDERIATKFWYGDLSSSYYDSSDIVKYENFCNNIVIGASEASTRAKVNIGNNAEEVIIGQKYGSFISSPNTFVGINTSSTPDNTANWVDVNRDGTIQRYYYCKNQIPDLVRDSWYLFVDNEMDAIRGFQESYDGTGYNLLVSHWDNFDVLHNEWRNNPNNGFIQGGFLDDVHYYEGIKFTEDVWGNFGRDGEEAYIVDIVNMIPTQVEYASTNINDKIEIAHAPNNNTYITIGDDSDNIVIGGDDNGIILNPNNVISGSTSIEIKSNLIDISSATDGVNISGPDVSINNNEGSYTDIGALNSTMYIGRGAGTVMLGMNNHDYEITNLFLNGDTTKINARAEFSVDSTNITIGCFDNGANDANDTTVLIGADPRTVTDNPGIEDDWLQYEAIKYFIVGARYLNIGDYSNNISLGSYASNVNIGVYASNVNVGNYASTISIGGGTTVGHIYIGSNTSPSHIYIGNIDAHTNSSTAASGVNYRGIILCNTLLPNTKNVLSASQQYINIGATANVNRFNTGYFKNVNYTGKCEQNSDERLKNFGDNLKIDFDALAQMRKANYTWKDTESYGEGNNIGVSAQEVQKLYPEVVTEDPETTILSVDYAKLSVVALAAIDELHKENVELKSRLDKLEELITKLTK